MQRPLFKTRVKSNRRQKSLVLLTVVLLATCVNWGLRDFAFANAQETQHSKVVVQLNGMIKSVEPFGGDSVYLGAWLNGNMPDIYYDWVNATGKGLAFYATMSVLAPQLPVPDNGTNPLDRMTLTSRLAEALPLLRQGLYSAVCLNWQTTFTCSSEDTGPNGSAFMCTQGVANGTFDNVIRENAKWIKSNFPYPLILRVNHEFDNPSSVGWGKDPEVYVAAWERIVNIFREENVSNVKWFWCPNFSSDAGVLYADYYPGDSYVDIIGIDMYANSWFQNANLMFNSRGSQNQNPICPYQFALDHNKPFAIGEWGLNLTDDLTDEQNAAWLSSMFELIKNNTDIKMIIHWGAFEWYLLNYPMATQVYRSYVSDSKFSSQYP